MEARPGNEKPAYYTVQEASEVLRMSPNHIRAAIRRGEIPGRQIGRVFRVSARAFDPEFDLPEGRPMRTPGSTWS